MEKISKTRFLSLQSQAYAYAYRAVAEGAKEVITNYLLPTLKEHQDTLGRELESPEEWDALDVDVARKIRKDRTPEDGNFFAGVTKSFAKRNELNTVPRGILKELERGYEKGIVAVLGFGVEKMTSLPVKKRPSML